VANQVAFALSLLLPLFTGYALLRLFLRNGNAAFYIGYGYFLGITVVTGLIFLYGSLGFALNFWPIAIILIAISIFSMLSCSREIGPPQPRHQNIPTTTWKRWVWWSLIAILVIRFTGLALEELWRPLYPWDAWMNWSPKAKTWFELKQLVPYVHPDNWPVESMRSGAYTLANPAASTYPPLVPLVQLWTAMGLGEWRDNWINLPWLLAGIAMGFAFYGQLRMLHIKPLWSMLSVYFLFSIPYFNTHVALAGYAELWVAGFYALGIMALVNWTLTGTKAQLALVVVMAVACVFTKKPGLVWALTLFLGVLMSLIPHRFRYASILLMAGGSTLWLFVGGLESILSPSNITIPGIIDFTIQYHPAGQYFAYNGIVRNNWHLLGWVGLLLSPPLIINMLRHQELLPLAVTLVSGVLFIIFVFFFTEHYNSAKDSTTINRAVFHPLPAFVFISIIAVLFRKKDTLKIENRNLV